MSKLNKSFFFTFLLTISNLLTIDYCFETAILNDKAVELKQEVKQIAYNTNFYLNYSKHFDTNFIVDCQAVQNELAKNPQHKEIVITTKDNHKLQCSFFNRKKDKIVIVGPGFTNAKEKMIPFAAILEDYDVLLINFRGHGHKNGFNLDFFYKIFGFESCIKLGNCEEEDVFAVLDFVNSKKQYDKVIGLGVCFGAFVFAKAQAIAQRNNIKAFDKLILDGCWPSLNEFADKIKKDPYLMVNPQKGGSGTIAKWLFSKKIVQDLILSYIYFITKVDLNSVDLRNYLKDIKDTPILFFYGKDDLTITRSEFEQIWTNTASTNKLAIITSNPHVHNHLKSKELYKMICDLFIEKDSIQSIVQILDEPKKLTTELIMKYKKTLNQAQENLKPIKFGKKEGLLQNLLSYKFASVFFASWYLAYKNGLVNFNTFKRSAQFYAMLKLAQILN